jgi:hypothetical protein
MEEKGTVSLWLGNFSSEELWAKYLEIVYSDDGDFEGSEFTKAFDIDYYDEDFKESDFYAQSSISPQMLLEGFSYDDQIISEFEQLIGSSLQKPYNCVLLLYNFRYDGTVIEAKKDDSILRYMGQTAYRL